MQRIMLQRALRALLALAFAALPALAWAWPDAPITLIIAGDGSMQWNGHPLDPTQLRAQLQVMAARSNSPPLQVIAATPGVLGQAQAVVAEAKQAGLVDVGVVQP